MTPTLDRNRDFGTIHGEHEFGAQFEQDGFFYDATGALIEDAMDSTQRTRFETRQRQDEAFAKARDAFREVMPEATDEQLAKLINQDSLKPANPNDEEIDLEKWGMGLQPKVLYSRVAQKIRQVYNQSPANKRQALEILAEHGVIAPIGGASTTPSMS
jgi:hypothetical protein